MRSFINPSLFSIKRYLIIAVVLAFAALVLSQTANPSLADEAADGKTFVHLFEWKWTDIAQECENFLGPKGFAAVQVSPPNEHIVAASNGYPWWQRYQPVSYQIESRSGTRAEFIDMVQRCNAVGVDIYVDAVINHMSAAGSGTGSNGSSYTEYNYPAVPFGYNDFHHCGRNGNDDIQNYGDRWEVQNCELVGLADLFTENGATQDKIAAYMNDLISIGVAGFRLDASKHMPAADIAAIKGKLNGTPYIFQEVIGAVGEPIQPNEYYGNGDVTEFSYSYGIGGAFINGPIKNLSTFGEPWGYMPSTNAVVFTDNHDNQRGHGGGGTVISHQHNTQNEYTLANIFMLAWPYGYPKIMSSYAFSNGDQGPPSDGNGNTNSIYNGGIPNCFGEWICEHRWQAIANMVGFRSATAGQAVANWWDNGNNQIAFSRGNAGFVAINKEGSTLNKTFQTALPAGTYCDIISGDIVGTGCTGNTVTVNPDGTANLSVLAGSAVAFYVGGTGPTPTPSGPTATFTPSPTVDPNGGITVHYKGWANPNIYAWVGASTNLRGAWPGTAMTAEANGWYVDTFPAETNINLIFNDGTQQTPDLSRTTGEWWYTNGTWTNYNPDGPTATPAPPTDTPTPTATTQGGTGITVHYKCWANPNIYAWVGASTNLRGTWPGTPMTAEANGWYVDTFPNETSINLIFNDGSQQTADLSRTTGEWWYDCSNTWTNYNPEGPTATPAPPTNIPLPTDTPDPSQGITVHYKCWANPNIYAWVGASTNLRGAWPGTAMTAEANGWYVDSFPNETSINLIFNDGSQQTADLSRTTGEWWYDCSNTWTTYNPEGPTATPVPATNTPTSAPPTNTPTLAPPTATFTPTPTAQPGQGITVHYKGWSTPNIYAWKGTNTNLRGAWPGTAMTDEGNGWYIDSFPNETDISLIFNSGGQQTIDLTRSTGEWWYLDGNWTSFNPEDTIPPTISLLSPNSGSYSGVVGVTVDAQDNVTIDRVEFYFGSQKVGESNTAPYSFNWDTAFACDRTDTLKAVAYDQAGNATDSQLVSITTANPNLAPVADAGNDIMIVVDGTANFNGSNSYDQDCNIVSYSWDNGLTGANPSQVYNQEGLYTVILTVTDDEGATDTDEVIVDVRQQLARTDFREETIYFVMTTRFYDGDPSNNTYCWDGASAGNVANNDPCWRGDFKGLIEKLDYIKALGFSAIWITPVVENMSGYDYHGYHAVDHSEIDPRYESEGYDYQRLIDEVHARGMKIIQDVVFNHTGNFGEENIFPMFSKDYTNPDTAENLVKTDPGNLLPADYDNLLPGAQFGARIDAMKEDFNDTAHIYHHEKSLSWESYTVQTGQIAGDAVDLNTENPIVQDYLINSYNQLIDMGVDGFRVDTVKHISRLTFNMVFNPAFKQRGGENFFMFGEVAARYRAVWNTNMPSISVPFYTWKESQTYPWGDRLTNEASVLQNWNDNQDVSTQPTSDNHALYGNTYHTPDWSMRSGLDQIDFPMHWSFNNAHDAYNLAIGTDNVYNDATWNVTYIDSHDYAPDGAPENQRFAGSQATWAENLSLIFTFRGIPTLYYGSEIEFKKGHVIDVGPNAPLEETGRAYFGDHIEGTINVTDFGQYSNATGAMATTLDYPLAQHIRRLNLIRRAVPALQKGQYSTQDVVGSMAYKRRYTEGGVDSFALITVSGNATFNNLPGGTYVDAITGNSITVSEGGSLTATCSGQGNLRVYILNGPGKIGQDGAYLN